MARVENYLMWIIMQTAKQSVILRIQVHCTHEQLNKSWKRRARLGRDTKNTDCRFLLRYIRSNCPLLPAMGNSHWLNFDASSWETVKLCLQQVIFNKWCSLPWWIHWPLGCSVAKESRRTFHLCEERFCFVYDNEKFVYQNVGQFW